MNVTPAYDVWTDVCVAPTNIESLTSVKLLTNANDDISGSGIEVALSNGKIRAEYLQNHTLRTIAIMTIQYTKTTDSSIAIGSDTDYSTTEKIVGTWIDGKPLYQKTISGSVTANAWNEMVHGIANIDLAFVKEAFVKTSTASNAARRLGGYGGVSTHEQYSLVQVDRTKIALYNSDSVFDTAIVTIQYTKTS